MAYSAGTCYVSYVLVCLLARRRMHIIDSARTILQIVNAYGLLCALRNGSGVLFQSSFFYAKVYYAYGHARAVCTILAAVTDIALAIVFALHTSSVVILSLRKCAAKTVLKYWTGTTKATGKSSTTALITIVSRDGVREPFRPTSLLLICSAGFV